MLEACDVKMADFWNLQGGFAMENWKYKASSPRRAWGGEIGYPWV